MQDVSHAFTCEQAKQTIIALKIKNHGKKNQTIFFKQNKTKQTTQDFIAS